MKQTAKWIGGPLCGIEDEKERFGTVWSGPDPFDPQHKVVIYVLHKTPHLGLVYFFDQRATNEANRLNTEGP